MCMHVYKEIQINNLDGIQQPMIIVFEKELKHSRHMALKDN